MVENMNKVMDSGVSSATQSSDTVRGVSLRTDNLDAGSAGLPAQ